MTDTLIDVASLFTEAAQLANEALQRNTSPDGPHQHRLNPEELREALDLQLPQEGQGLDAVLELARKTLKYSVATGHPRFLNQLFGGQDVAGLLGDWISALTNTSMYTYEVAPVGTVVEHALVERLCEYVGYENGEGVFAPGGSIANLMAVLTARHRAFPHMRTDGIQPGDNPVMFTSAESHYSIARGALVAGVGTANCVQVPTDSVGRMDPEALERLVQQSIDQGKTPFMVVATVGTTVSGAFDPMNRIADVTEKHNMWLHADGSYGGSVLFSDKYRKLLDGIHRADSVTWNPHKMMGVPLTCSALLVKEPGSLVSTLAMHAEYLFHEDAGPVLDLGDRSLQCGRRVDALKLWFSWQAMGDAGYAQRIDYLFDQAEEFRDVIRARKGFRLIREQEGSNVCFRYLPAEYEHLIGDERDKAEHEATLRTRAAILDEGSFMVNYAQLEGAATYRIVMSNPQTTIDDLKYLLERIEA